MFSLKLHSGLENISKNTSSNNDNNNSVIHSDITSDILKSFFGQSNRIFAPERFILSQIITWTAAIQEGQLYQVSLESNHNFEIGTKILFWEIIAKSNKEIVLSWEWRGHRGFTLLGYDDASNTMYHGNLLPWKNKHANNTPLLFYKLLHKFHVVYATLLTAETGYVLCSKLK